MAASPAAPLPPLFPTAAAADDEDFGDFEFAPPLTLLPITTNVDDEDEWGDFVESPIHFDSRSRPFDPLPGKQEGKKLWERPRGAIPLSIFGEEDPVGSGDSDAKDSFFSPRGEGGVDFNGKYSFFSPRGEDGVNSNGKDSFIAPKAGSRLGGVAIRDLLDDLYGQVDKVEGCGVSCGDDVGVVVEDDDFDEGGWEFKGAVADGGFGDQVVVESVQVVKKDEDIETDGLQFGVGNSKQELDNGGMEHDAFTSSFDLFPGVTHTAGCNGDRGFDSTNVLIPKLANGNASFDKKHGEAKDAISEAEVLDFFPWKKEEGKDDTGFSTKVNTNTPGGKFQDFGDLWESQAEDVTMPTFKTGKQDPDCLFDVQNDFFVFEKTLSKSEAKDNNVNHLSSYNDLLLNLYEEHGQASFDLEDSNDNRMDSSTEVFFNNLSSENDLQDSHMSATNDSLGRVEDKTIECVDTHQALAKPSPETFIGFYSKLKDASCLLALHHLGDLKKAHELAALSNEETKARDLHLQIQASYGRLQCEVEDSSKIPTDGCCISQVSCKQLLESLKCPIFQDLEMEYSLSEKIELAQDDLTSAVQLFEHAVIILHILKLGHSQDQQDYIINWSKILTVCEQELQHGATILAQSLQADVYENILSEPKGCDYFLALGEIYRVAEILNTSLTVYKPWIMSNPAGSKNLFAIVNRCYKFWMDAGLSEALEDMSDQADHKIKEKTKKIFESINFIRNFSVVAIQSHMSSHKEPACHLSLLPLIMFQADMEVVAWNGENYFTKLASLWANRISKDPPKLTCTVVG